MQMGSHGNLVAFSWCFCVLVVRIDSSIELFNRLSREARRRGSRLPAKCYAIRNRIASESVWASAFGVQVPRFASGVHFSEPAAAWPGLSRLPVTCCKIMHLQGTSGAHV